MVKTSGHTVSRRIILFNYTVCPRSSSCPFYVLSYYIKWVTTSGQIVIQQIYTYIPKLTKKNKVTVLGSTGCLEGPGYIIEMLYVHLSSTKTRAQHFTLILSRVFTPFSPLIFHSLYIRYDNLPLVK